MMTKIDRFTEMIWEARNKGDEPALAILEDCVSALFEAHYVCEGTRDWLMDQFNEPDPDEFLLEEFDDDELLEEFDEDDVVSVEPLFCDSEDRVLEYSHTLQIGDKTVENCTYLDVIRIAEEKGVCKLYAAYSDLGNAIENLYTDNFVRARGFVAKNDCGAICVATVFNGMLEFHDNIYELAQ